MRLTPRGHKALRGLACAILFVRTLAVCHRFGQERHDGPLVRREDRGAQPLMRRGQRPMAVDPAYTGGAVHRLGRKISRASKGHKIMAIKQWHGFQRLATLEVPQDALERGAEPLGGDRVKDCAQARVARDPLHAGDGGQIPLSPFLVKGQERGRFEGNHRQGRQKHIGSGYGQE
jgi:hypothetical protein